MVCSAELPRSPPCSPQGLAVTKKDGQAAQGELAHRESESSGQRFGPSSRAGAIFMNEASEMESHQHKDGSHAAFCSLALQLEKSRQWKTRLLVLVSPEPHLHRLLDPEGVSHVQPLPPISLRAAFCKVIFLYLLKLLFKEEFLIITQPQRADTVWLCLFSFS